MVAAVATVGAVPRHIRRRPPRSPLSSASARLIYSQVPSRDGPRCYFVPRSQRTLLRTVLSVRSLPDRNFRKFATAFLGLLGYCLSGGDGSALSAADKPEWKVGLAQGVITPKMPVYLAGYANRNRPFTGIEHELWVKALVLEDNAGHRGMILTSDLVGFPASIAEPICQRIQQHCDLRREQILINASHTHTGPLLVVDAWSPPAMTPSDAERTAEYVAWLGDQVVDTAARACQRMAPAKLAWGVGAIPFAMNRREYTSKGVILGVNARGLADRQVPVLRVDGEDGQLRAILFGAAVHGTTLTGNDYEICGDYAGFAQEILQEQHPNVQAMFMIGLAGDTNPYPRGNMKLAREHGQTLAAEVDRGLASKLLPITGPLTIAFEQVDLPLADVPSRDELEQWVKQGGTRGMVAKQMLPALAGGRELPKTYRAPFTVWQMGHELTLVGLPGEVVVDYVPLLEKAIGPERLWLAGYCNDVFGYLPSARVLAEGGYETRGLINGGIGLFSPAAEGVVVATVRRLAERVGRPVPGADQHPQ